MTMRTEHPLATFVDRHTVVYERTYPQLIEVYRRHIATECPPA